MPVETPHPSAGVSVQKPCHEHDPPSVEHGAWGQRSPCGVSRHADLVTQTTSGQTRPRQGGTDIASYRRVTGCVRATIVSRIIDIQAAADLLAVDYKTVYRLIQNGELPAAKIGRIYRLAQDDVEHYFEQRKTATMRELQANGHRRRASIGARDASAERPCVWCGRDLVLNYSIGGECAEPGCAAPICRACARDGAELCPIHVKPGDRSAQVERLRAEGGFVVGVEELRALAGSYLANVAGRLDELSSWPGEDGRPIARNGLIVVIHHKPSADGWLALDDRSPVPFEVTIALRRRLRPGAVLLDVVFLPVLHRHDYTRFGFDVRPCTVDDLRAASDTAAAVGRGRNVVLALWSPTGWTERASVTAGSLRGSDRRPVLVDAGAGCCDRVDGYIGYLVNPSSDEEALAQCAASVRSAVGGNASVCLDVLVENGGFHREIAQRCLKRLAATHDYEIDQFDDLGMVISRR
ncbi:MAG: helix-turn-helix domain-containing protein [Verrucomicrobia bacterium]|nr:helix-turn-helix domain-containing protein [Verrucomicrobiota bacterium]